MSLDLDPVVAVEQVEMVESVLREFYRVERFPHSINVFAPGSKLRVRIQTDPRYSGFLERAEVRDVLGMPLPVAAVEDVLQGKIWAALDPERRPSKRRKDLLDIERLVEAFPELWGRVPEEVLDRLGRAHPAGSRRRSVVTSLLWRSVRNSWKFWCARPTRRRWR